MAFNSSDVVVGDDILASSYNNLRLDLTEIRDASANLAIGATKKIFLDGVGGGGDTYIIESVANIIDIFTGGTRVMTLKDIFVQIIPDLLMNSTSKLRLDGSSAGDTYIVETSADIVDLVVGGSVAMKFRTAFIQVGSSRDLLIEPTQKIRLDGSSAGDTYITESSANIVDYVVGNSIQMRMDSNGIAPGDNESMSWDVVIFSLDGTSSDTVTYVVDESKIYGLAASGHVTTVVVESHTDTSVTSWTRAAISSDVLSVSYGSDFGSGDASQVIIFYIN